MDRVESYRYMSKALVTKKGKGDGERVHPKPGLVVAAKKIKAEGALPCQVHSKSCFISKTQQNCDLGPPPPPPPRKQTWQGKREAVGMVLFIFFQRKAGIC